MVVLPRLPLVSLGEVPHVRLRGIAVSLVDLLVQPIEEELLILRRSAGERKGRVRAQ